ncbi:MAG: hypothetical protein IPK22_17705 [Verrucomicrobiaceae bacterium]|nr:hypothetical protein [Verrucomicrobiaceae bacterium]
MIEEDLQRIEAALNVSLPRIYRSHMKRFPFAVLRGNSEHELWDDAEALIQLNLELREPKSDGADSWSSDFFAIGRNSGGIVYAMNLREEGAPVDSAPFGRLDEGDSCETRPFDFWLVDYVRDKAADLVSDGIDPTESAELLAARQKRSGWQDFASCLGCLVLAAGGLFVVGAVIKWVKSMLFGG